MSDHSTHIFADGITSVRLANGVVRVNFGSLDADNKLQPAGMLILPVAQFHRTVQNLANAVNDLVAKAKDAQAQQGQVQEAAVEADAGSSDGGTTH